MTEGDSIDLEALISSPSETDLREAVRAIVSFMRQVAARRMRGLPLGFSLTPSDVASLALLKFLPVVRGMFQDVDHLVSLCESAIRSVIRDHLRRRRAHRRASDRRAEMPEDVIDFAACDPERQFEVMDLMEKLSAADAGVAMAARLRAEFGLSNEEIATVLEVSVPTVERRLRAARRWFEDVTGVAGGES